MLSQAIEYALRALIYLASMDGQVASAEKIAAHTRVSRGYLSKVMRGLAVANMVRSCRGPNAGFVLARGAATISLLDVANAMDRIRRISCCPAGDPSRTQLCDLHQLIVVDISNDEVNQMPYRGVLRRYIGPGSARVKDGPVGLGVQRLPRQLRTHAQEQVAQEARNAGDPLRRDADI